MKLEPKLYEKFWRNQDVDATSTDGDSTNYATHKE